MAVDTRTHRVVHNAFRDSHSRDIAVARRAVDLGAKVRGVDESHVRFIVPSIDSLPGNVFSALMVSQDFLDLRVIRQGVGMTAPARPDVRNAGLRTSCCGNMTIRT